MVSVGMWLATTALHSAGTDRFPHLIRMPLLTAVRVWSNWTLYIRGGYTLESFVPF